MTLAAREESGDEGPFGYTLANLFLKLFKEWRMRALDAAINRELRRRICYARYSESGKFQKILHSL